MWSYSPIGDHSQETKPSRRKAFVSQLRLLQVQIVPRRKRVLSEVPGSRRISRSGERHHVRHRSAAEDPGVRYTQLSAITGPPEKRVESRKTFITPAPVPGWNSREEGRAAVKRRQGRKLTDGGKNGVPEPVRVVCAWEVLTTDGSSVRRSVQRVS